MENLKKSQTFQNLLKKFNVQKENNVDLKKNARNKSAHEHLNRRREQNVGMTNAVAPRLELSVRKSARDVKKPERYDPSPKVNTSSRVLPRTGAAKELKSTLSNLPEESEDEALLSASMVAESPTHRSAFSRVARPPRPDPEIPPKADSRLENWSRSQVTGASSSQLNVSRRQALTYEREDSSNRCFRPTPTLRQNNSSYLHPSMHLPVGATRSHNTFAQTMRLTELNRNEALKAPARPPVQPKRDDVFLRPVTPPNPLDLKIISQQEQSDYFDVLEEFANSHYLSAIEIIHFQNRLSEKIKVKIAKELQLKQINQRILRGPVGENYGVVDKDAAIQSWLRSTSCVAHPPAAHVNPKRYAPDYQNIEAKRRRLDLENQH